MISFRYHVVTIVAVFLALALGLLAGSAFVQPRLVDELRRRTDAQLDTIAELRGEVTDVQQELSDLRGFADVALPYLAEGRLVGTEVVMVVQEGVQDEVLAEVGRALDEAGASVVASFSARRELASDDPATQEELAALIERPGAKAEELPGLAAQALAERLASLGRRAASTQPDLLHELLSGGFLAPIGSGIDDATLGLIGGPTQVIVVLSGASEAEPSIPPQDFAVPLVEALVDRGIRVAAGEATDSGFPFVQILRANGTGTILTVDDLDQGMGGIALVLGLEELLLSGRGGAYGVKDGAELLPPS